MAYLTQIEKDIDNMLFRIEFEMDVETAMEAQLAIIEGIEQPEEEGGFYLLEEDDPGCQIFPMPQHCRLIRVLRFLYFIYFIFVIFFKLI